MKKLLSIFLTISLIATTVGALAFSEVDTDEENKNGADAIINEVNQVIISFYENKDLGSHNDLSNVMDNSILSYLADKSETNQHVLHLYDVNLLNYNVKPLLLNSKLENNLGYFEYQIVTTFNTNISPNIETIKSEVAYLTYDYDKSMILDFYVPSNYYDEHVRSADIIGSPIDSFSLDSQVKSLQNSLARDIDNVYAQQAKDQEVIDSPKIEAEYRKTSRSATALNRDAIVTYARNNFKLNPPASSSNSFSYYDFYTGNGSYDCTNFVSHALYAGGAKMKSSSSSGIQHNSYWYFRTANNRSSAWTSVNNLYTYLTTNTTANTLAGTSRTYSLNGAYWGVGDILQLGGNSTWSHSTIITRKDKSSDGTRSYAIVTGRTGPNLYNDNMPVDIDRPNYSKRTISCYNN